MITKENKLIDLTLLDVFREELLAEVKEWQQPVVSQIEFNEETGDLVATYITPGA